MMQTLETFLAVAEQVAYEATGEHLNDLQRMILLESWQAPKKTYEQIAREHNYSGNYIQQVAAPRLWRLFSEALGQKVTKFNVRSVLERHVVAQLTTHNPDRNCVLTNFKGSVSTTSLEYPTGSVPIDSPFYVQRSIQESLCYQNVLQPSSLIRIKAPRQMGKTSLMLRILAYAKTTEMQTVTLNFQQVEKAILADLHKLLRWFCTCITQKLKLTPQLATYWDNDIGSKMSCTLYMEGYLLEGISSPLVLALEEVSELFEYPAIAQEFFTMLRTWHEHSKTDSTWQKLRLILVQSTEPYIHLNVNQSPFNLGIEVALTPFTTEQVESLIDLHNLQLSTHQIQQLMHLLQGHPFLTRWTLYYLAQFQHSFEEMMAIAVTDAGIYHDHLHRHLGILQRYPELREALLQVLNATEPVELEQVKAFKLYSMGLVKLAGNQVMITCDLYRQYFRGRC